MIIVHRKLLSNKEGSKYGHRTYDKGMSIESKLKFVIILIFLSYLVGVLISHNLNLRGKNITYKSVNRTELSIKNDKEIYLDSESIALADCSKDVTYLRKEAISAFNLVNDLRMKKGLNPLLWSPDLETTSLVRAQESCVFFSHTRPNGEKWYTVNSTIMGGENLAYGFNDANSALNAWMNSPTHRENILYPTYTKIAISVYVADNGTYYWSQEFGY